MLHWETQVRIPDNEGVYEYPHARNLKARVDAALTDRSIPYSDFIEDHDRLRRLEAQQRELLPRYAQGLVETINERARSEGKTIRARTKTAIELGTQVAWISYTATEYNDWAIARADAVGLQNASLDNARWRIYPACLPDEKQVQAPPEANAKSNGEPDTGQVREHGLDDDRKPLRVGDLRFGATITHFVDGWPFDINGPIDRDRDSEITPTPHLPEVAADEEGPAEPGSEMSDRDSRSEEVSPDLSSSEPEFEI